MRLLRCTAFPFLVILLIAGIAEAGEFAPAVYAGESKEKNYACHVVLFLGKSGEFSLQQDITLPNGKVSGFQTTGKWYKIRNESFLQLTNNNDFNQLLNIGGAGALYLNVPFPNAEQVTLTLRARQSDPPKYIVSGLLHASGNKLFLENIDSGIMHSVVVKNVVTEFLKEHGKKSSVLPVRAEVVPVEDAKALPALQIQDIRGAVIKNRDARLTPKYFLDAVAEKRWKITQIGAQEHATRINALVSFIPNKGKSDGRLEIFFDGQYVTGAYTLQGAGLALSAVVREDRIAELIRRTRSWQLSGEVLELWDGKQLLALLEETR